jgi:hypothetical protein
MDVGVLYADLLAGGTGADKFVILTNGEQNMLTAKLFDTITDLNLGADTIGLAFAVDSIATSSAITGGTLAAAVQTLFNVGGVLRDAGQTAGIFTYGIDAYLVMTDEGGTSFGADDAIVKITGVTGTLDTTDFYVVSTAAVI